ncbi:cardiomyopathy-associated protein 5 [Myxocyprinus asiaticus]|uniref:cardiomyopathy-associated protein 5 n=1 Tax=Myxocyprinus asiaticus TaxID=70543 RepID=UPI0022217E8B|nr:cardiomyopathy-associated protein 5 [Myxocyprinus asiaticus]
MKRTSSSSTTALINATCNKMETMEIMDPESQITVLQDEMLLEGEEEQMSDEVEDLNNSLREVVQDGVVKPKLHCLMMDPSFSMVTVQSEDSGIIWETASSRCSTPWTSEFNSVTSEPLYNLTGPGAAGRIVFIMDEELMSRTKRRRYKMEKTKTCSHVSAQIIAEAQRPAMVEVSLPNVTPVDGQEEEKITDPKEERRQRLFSLVSEGSEILNIVVPPKVSTVDEEESKGLEDHLFYLEETPAVRSADILDEPDVDIYCETPAEKSRSPLSVIPEPSVHLSHIQASRQGATAEDYFEMFTLLDHQTPSGTLEVQEEHQDTEGSTEDKEDNTLHPDAEPESGLSGVSSAVSMFNISGEHLDDVFYGGGSDPQCHDASGSVGEKERELSKSSLKESGSALFGSEETVLTPVYLPEGPQKIIDPNLLEEPKAMAFLYSDLYADAIGMRKKPDDEDAESVTSEKSFHSQESDYEDKGYLEKFVLKVETLAMDRDVSAEVHHEDQQDSFRYMQQHTTEERIEEEEPDEITDFFRNSGSSSPCEPADREPTESEEETEAVRTPRVTFKDDVTKNKTEQTETQLSITDDTDFKDAFLPVEISDDCPAWEEDLLTFAKMTKKSTSTRTDEVKHKASCFSKTSQEPPTLIQANTTIKPVIPQHKPFLDLTALLPAETPDETENINRQQKLEGRSSEASQDDGSSQTKAEDLEYEVIRNQEESLVTSVARTRED